MIRSQQTSRIVSRINRYEEIRQGQTKNNKIMYNEKRKLMVKMPQNCVIIPEDNPYGRATRNIYVWTIYNPRAGKKHAKKIAQTLYGNNIPQMLDFLEGNKRVEHHIRSILNRRFPSM